MKVEVVDKMVDLECTFDDNEVIVIDTGSGYTTVGEGVGHAGNQVRQILIGEEAFATNTEDLVQPVERAEFQVAKSETGLKSKESIEHIWTHCFKKILRLTDQDLEAQNILVLLNNNNNATIREWIAELLFEKFKVSEVIFLSSIFQSTI